VNTYKGGTVYETFLNKQPCKRVDDPADGLLLALAAGRPHTVRWQRNLGASETSPLIVGKRLYIGTAQGNVFCLDARTGKTIWQYHVGAPVKGAIAYDGGKVFFGAYDGHLYSLGAASGKLIWTASSASDFTGARGHFYSTPAVAYSRVYLGSTDGKVYAFDEATGKLAWAHATGSYVYGSPAVYGGRVFVGSYNHVFYALDAATGAPDWTFTANGPISGSATVVGGLVYFANLGTRDSRRTFALDVRTGQKVWQWRDGGFTPVVTDGSKLYVVGWAKMYAFTPRRSHG
jgi:outer membrane protein assembly factor BamB